MLFSFSTERLTEKEQRRMFWRRLFRRVFLEDWGTKLIALGIAFALWLGISGLRTNSSFTLKPVPLIIQLPNDMEITSNNPTQEISLLVTGDKKQIEQLIAQVNARDLIASIDLTDIKSGDNIVQLSPDTVSVVLPNGVKFVKVEPSKISVKVEKLIEKDIPVKVETEGNLPDGFELLSTNVVPAKVRVRGAESFVKSLDSISTEKINIDGLKDNYFAKQVGLNVINPRITPLDTLVDVQFRISEKQIEKSFLVPVKIENVTKKVSFTLTGGRSIIEKIQPENLKVEITKGEKGEEVPTITLPDDLQDKVEIKKPKIVH